MKGAQDDDEEDPSVASSSDSEDPVPWTISLQLSGSVYDDAFLAPLLWIFDHPDKRPPSSQISRLLLPVCLLLQLLVIFKVGALTADAESYFDRILVQEGEERVGYCEVATMEEMDEDPVDFQMLANPKKFPNGVKSPDPKRVQIDCTPYDTMALQGFDYLDKDHDGYWSHEDARIQEVLFGRDYGVNVEFGTIQRNIYTALTEHAMEIMASKRMEADPNVTHAANSVLQGLRAANGSLPRDIFASQVEPFYKMCLLMDSDLCGNAVFRKALNLSSFLEPSERLGFRGAPLAFVANDLPRGARVNSMVHICEVALKSVCPVFLAVDYRLYQANRKEACGAVGRSIQHMDPDPLTSGRQVLTVEFGAASAHTLTMLSWTFISFLALILILWAVTMLKEAHVVLIWWRVLAGFLLPLPASKRSFLARKGETVELRFVPRAYCRRTIIFNLLPRTLICMATAYMGTKFLLSAESYESLIINSLALAFFTNVDRLMYAAFVPSWRKEWIDQSKPLPPPANAAFDRAIRCLVSDAFLFGFVFVYTVGCLLFAYLRPIYGNQSKAEMVTCLCQMSGPRCLAAWILGGFESIREVPGYWS